MGCSLHRVTCPKIFSGKLPDLNFGTADASSCDQSLQNVLSETILNSANCKNFSHIFNGRFKGGYITRNYGVPAMNIHAVQLEISQCIYMEEKPPYKYEEYLAKNVKPALTELLDTCLTWAKNQK